MKRVQTEKLVRSLLRKGLVPDAKVRHSRMVLSGIQARFELDLRLRHSGVTPLA
jgi:hypothetical protein